MQLTLQNIRKWATAEGYEPSAFTGPHTLRWFIHDVALTCDACSARYTERDDFDPDYLDAGEWVCETCALDDNFAPTQDELRRTERTF
jgi:hypothetical protein